MINMTNMVIMLQPENAFERAVLDDNIRKVKTQVQKKGINLLAPNSVGFNAYASTCDYVFS